MNNKKHNERKLIKNIDNIIIKYIKVNDKILEAIVNDDLPAFKEQTILASSDHFLDGILDEYETFTSLLKDEIENLHRSELNDLKQKKLRDFKIPVKKKKVQIPFASKKKVSAIKKGKRTKWSNKETYILERGINAGQKPAAIRITINTERQNEGLKTRSYASISSKYYRIKKQELN